MTDRHTADTITSADLDDLYDERDMLRRDIRRAQAALTLQGAELERARTELQQHAEADSADDAAGSYAHRAEAAENRLRLAHQARRAKEHQLDGIRRALCDAGFMQDDDPYSHADLEDVIRQAAPAEAAPAPVWAPPPPGSTREQLPDEILALLDGYLDPYLSTACATAGACQAAAETHPVDRPWLTAHADDLHVRCRLNNKFTGQICVCGCHRAEEPS